MHTNLIAKVLAALGAAALIARKFLLGSSTATQPGGMYPRYQKAFYTPLKEMSSQTIDVSEMTDCHGDLQELKAAIEKTANSYSFCSLVSFVSKDDPAGDKSMWRIDYVKPDRIHVLQLVGYDIDEWITIGDRSWSGGALWFEFATDKLMHSETSKRIMIVKYLAPLVGQAVTEASKLRCTKDAKTFQLFGPFSNLRNVPEFFNNSKFILLRINELEFIDRVDFRIEIEESDEVFSMEIRHAFAAHNQEISVAPPGWVNAVLDNDGQMKIVDNRICEPFFHPL